MHGRFSQDTPGFLRRRGPIQKKGLALSDQIGSRQKLRTPLPKQHGRVVHESGPQRAFYAAGRYGLLDVRYDTGRRFRPAGQLPAEDIHQPGRLPGIRIVEALSVEVLWKPRVACVLPHEPPCFHTPEPLAPGRRNPRLLRFERSHIDREAVLHIGPDQSLVSFIDLLNRDDFDIGGNIMCAAKVEHLLGLGNPADG